MLLRLRILLATQFLLPLAFALVGLGNAHAQVVPGQGTWQDTLLGRDINLNAVAATDASAVYLYDKTLDVTWLRDANRNGAMDWATATNWAASLVTGSGAAAISDWRLPTMADPAANCNFWTYDGGPCGHNPAPSTSEMASLFFSTLGNKAYYDTSGNPQSGYGVTNAGSFQNMQSFEYWLGTESAAISTVAWIFNTYYGFQYHGGYKLNQLYALAVRTGDVAPIPEPETFAMLLAGLGVLGAVTRRRHSDNSLATKS